ncbi:hypothetical protein [Mammaliicoccus sp. G-M28]|uniref:hypothetical protein n=1 Tax=Mammaliicoccus sp. G-M28 TaxID=2898688 RepID=UPI001EFAECF0|nr:hypothetical protein [Mammaliicoccus sp. G-M28]
MKFYLGVDKLLDLNFVSELVEDKYRLNNGRPSTGSVTLVKKIGMSTVNWTIFMWYLIYNSLAFDSSMNHEFYDD